MKDTILNAVEDLAGDFLYYDRKGDEDLPLGAIEAAIARKEVSIDEIVALFEAKVKETINE
jgi:hypothetical protein